MRLRVDGIRARWLEGGTRAWEVSASEWPTDWDQHDGQDPKNKVQGRADAQEVREPITSRSVDHHVRLIADRRHETGGRRECQRHQEGTRIHLIKTSGFNAEGEHQDRYGIVGNHFRDGRTQEVDYRQG